MNVLSKRQAMRKIYNFNSKIKIFHASVLSQLLKNHFLASFYFYQQEKKRKGRRNKEKKHSRYWIIDFMGLEAL